MHIYWKTMLLLFVSQITFAQEANRVLPSKAQLRWQSYEQIMFVCLDPATWQGREYDNHSMDLNRINPTLLHTDQWCQTARLWNARLILFVAKHTGGFCWWNTQTSTYGIKETPWKEGKGDVLADLARSCKKYGLDLGVYIYPGDEQWGAGIGSGGTTKDPAKQEAYNQVFRQQLTEVLTKYGPIREVWFDGNCNVPVTDLLQKHTKDAVVFQGKSATIRWVGNEDGRAPDPNWYTLKKEDLSTGVSTALHSDPEGDVYAPVEVDVPLLKNGGHKWFWAPDTDSLLMNTEQLMNLYYNSVGRGAVLLLNSTPDTTGLIPTSHVETYKRFGDEIHKRFSRPISETKGNKEELIIDFKKKTTINHVVLQEDLSKGQRVLSYIIEGSKDGNWTTLYQGSSIGNKKIDFFRSIEVDKIKVRFLKFKSVPQIKKFAVYNVQSALRDFNNNEKPVVISTWQATSFDSEWKEVVLDLTRFVNAIGQYEVYFSTLAYDFTNAAPFGLEIKEFELEMYGGPLPDALTVSGEGNVIQINRSQQTLDEFPTILKMKVKSKPARSSGDILIKRIVY